MKERKGEDRSGRIRELVNLLNRASRAYYAEDREIISNYDYDAAYDELVRLERETGLVLANSPTVSVGYGAVDYLPKESHETPMLSLDKTKDREALADFADSQRTLLSWKLDGLTIVLTYREGELFKAVTRGNGRIGEVVTGNARTFCNLPLRIPYRGELILRGEALITYSDFERINEQIADIDARYKNPRNLCSGSVRQLDSRITADRSVRFYAFSLVRAEGVDFKNSHERELVWLKDQGFEIVPYRLVTGQTMAEAVTLFAGEAAANDFPSDGLVALYDDISYGESLGATAKFPRNAMAFKWADEKRISRLIEIEWNPSRTGLINPVAVFEPVELEGTTVTRASVHNVSILRDLSLCPGDEIEVYKANMIIPQIADNLSRSGKATIPDTCPACGGRAEIHDREGVETLLCVNPACPAKEMKSYTLLVSRDALNIEGLSEATLSKLMAHGLIRSAADIFRLDRHKEIIVSMEGFGEKSYEKLIQGIDRARVTTPSRLIYALGIPGIGLATARLICRHFSEDLDLIRSADRDSLAEVEGIGPVLAEAFAGWWDRNDKRAAFEELAACLTLHKEFDGGEEAGSLSGKVFVITGSVSRFANRSALKAEIERLGGKVTGSVSKNTDYLINNDRLSTSGKNKKAAELGIPILSEEEFLDLSQRGE